MTQQTKSVKQVKYFQFSIMPMSIHSLTALRRKLQAKIAEAEKFYLMHRGLGFVSVVPNSGTPSEDGEKIREAVIAGTGKRNGQISLRKAPRFHQLRLKNLDDLQAFLRSSVRAMNAKGHTEDFFHVVYFFNQGDLERLMPVITDREFSEPLEKYSWRVGRVYTLEPLEIAEDETFYPLKIILTRGETKDA